MPKARRKARSKARSKAELKEGDGKQVAAVCFTQWVEPETFYAYWKTCDLDENVQYLAYQLELAPHPEDGHTGLHIQGYMELVKKKTFGGIVNMPHFRGAHLMRREGTQEEAIDYVMKEETRVEEPVERGKKKQQGRRTDLEEVAQLVRAGTTMQQLADTHPTAIIRYHRGLSALEALVARPTARPTPTVRFLWGPPRTGKSLIAYTAYPEAYRVTEHINAWMDRYRGEEVIIFDDFKGVFPLGLMLKLVDRYPLCLPVKGADVIIKAHTFLFTSNEHPNIFYGGDPAWMGRINEFGQVQGLDDYKAEADAIKATFTQ